MNGRDLSALEGHNYVRMTTYRRDGREVATPVWFAFPAAETAGGTGGERIYVVTGPNTGKAKRLRAGSPVDLTPCNFRGTPVRGADTVRTAGRFLDEPESEAAEAALRAKYGWQYRAFTFVENRASRGRSERVFIELTPAPQE